MSGVQRRWLVAAALVLLPTSKAAGQSAPTFAKDIAEILYEHCAACHRPGEIGGFSLLRYEDVRPRAAAIARATRMRAMPPWKPEPGYGEFIGARRLTTDQINLIQRWAAAGAPRGDPTDLPRPPATLKGWRLGEPDLVVTLSEPYTLPPGGADTLRNFVIPIPTSSTHYVAGLEFRPGNPRVVHHANMRIDRTSASRARDRADPQPGYDGFISTGAFPDGHFLGWTPGQLPPLVPATAWRLEPGSDLVLQLHMQPTGNGEVVQPSIALFFTDTPPARVPLMLRLGRHDIDIPAGASNYTIEDQYELPIDVEILGVQPHAHYRAREIQGTAILPDGTRRPLLFIKDWDFNWQDAYRYAAPIVAPKGTTLAMRIAYDNSASNRRNPDRPPRRVRWGENSSDEMGNLWIQVLPRTPEERRRLEAAFAPKVMADDAAGYEKRLEVDRDNVKLHEAAAALALALGRTERAIEHLQRALELDEASVEAHYNLGLAFARAGRADEAIAQFHRALRLAPAHVSAHANLGALFRSQNELERGAEYLRTALQLDPANAAAHTNLAAILSAQGATREAIGHYRRALETNPDLLEPLTDLAWILATASDVELRDAAEAVRLAERAVDVTARSSVRALDTLATAYAAAGRLADALATGEAALALAEAAGDVESARQLRGRLANYRQRND